MRLAVLLALASCGPPSAPASSTGSGSDRGSGSAATTGPKRCLRESVHRDPPATSATPQLAALLAPPPALATCLAAAHDPALFTALLDPSTQPATMRPIAPPTEAERAVEDACLAAQLPKLLNDAANHTDACSPVTAPPYPPETGYLDLARATILLARARARTGPVDNATLLLLDAIAVFQDFARGDVPFAVAYPAATARRMLAMALAATGSPQAPALVAGEPPLVSYLRGEHVDPHGCTTDRACFDAVAPTIADRKHLEKLVGAMGAVPQVFTFLAAASCDGNVLPPPASELTAIERTPSGRIEVGAPAWVFGGESPVVYFASPCRLRP